MQEAVKKEAEDLEIMQNLYLLCKTKCFYE